MYIERIQIEEGFLDGLDVFFTSGLNVIIGARGTGKTSLIELIRFCLNINSTPEQHKRSLEHALSVLGSGQVTVTLNDNEQKIVVTRTVGDPSPRATGEYDLPLIFSQTEIETIGLEANGRIRLIDSFLEPNSTDIAIEELIISEVNSLTAEIEELQRDTEDLEKQLGVLPTINEELKKLDIEEKSVSASSIELKNKTNALQVYSEQISKFSVTESQGKFVQDDLATWYNLIKNASEFRVKTTNISPEVLAPLLPKIEAAQSQIAIALENVRSVWAYFDTQTKELNSKRIESEGFARSLRQEVEVMQTGAGNLMRKIQELKQNQAKLNSLREFVKTRKLYISELLLKRSNALDRLDDTRLSRFNLRGSIVNKLNQRLQPSIKIELIRNGQQSAFFSVLTDMLRGTGLKYGDVAKTLSEHISPRALLEAVDNFDVDLIADIAQMTKERASRVLAQLRTSSLGPLGTLQLDDDVSFQLLDGMDYKELNSLSTGQRCTVVLPIVLAHEDKMLIVDQPEDHIDNAFITNTLIKSVLNRPSKGQIIFTTHNPNIPVLGNADTVLHLGSDGKHGFVEALGSLNEEPIVDAISTVMEGGEEAFSKRAAFYNQFF